MQVVPDNAHWTIDVPGMNAAWSAKGEPVWRWLHEPWTYPVPEDSHAITDLAAMRGERITASTRWEDNYWEVFAGAGSVIAKEGTRVVPIGTLLASDESLARLLTVDVGSGLWREADSQWHTWGKSEG